MTASLKYHTFDYREAQEKFSKFKTKGTTYQTYDFKTHEYTIEVKIEISSKSDLMRTYLSNLYENVKDIAAQEELDALEYADSAIKTLVDMGVLE